MIAITRPLHRLAAPLAAFALALGVVGVSAARAEPAQDTGDNIMLEAVEAAKKLESLSATVTMTGAGGFKDYVPTGTGTIRLTKQAEPVDGSAWMTRVDADYVHKKGSDVQKVNALRLPDLFIYVDHEKKSVQERQLSDRRSIFSSVVDLMGLPEVTAASPYNRELREATEWNALDRETINGVLCDVVEVRFDMAKGDDADATSVIRTPAAKWYFGVEDRLPRRVERITDEGMISFTIILELSDLKINPGIDPASLAIETPEGYSRTLAAKRSSRDSVDIAEVPAVKRQMEAEPASAPSIDPTMVKLPAHGFELVDGDGNDVSLDSLKGNVAVLYFWGTWCVPCREYSPLVSDLVTTFEGEPVKVFGLPVRERDEAAVRDAISKYNHTLLLNKGGTPIGCDETARAYKVRRYPTVYVIGANSEILAVKFPEVGVEPAETMAEIERIIREYLATMN